MGMLESVRLDNCDQGNNMPTGAWRTWVVPSPQRILISHNSRAKDKSLNGVFVRMMVGNDTKDNLSDLKISRIFTNEAGFAGKARMLSSRSRRREGYFNSSFCVISQSS